MTQVYQMDQNELLRNANTTLNMVVDGLRLEGFLTKEQAEEIHKHYSVIVESKSWLPEFLANWLKIDKNMKIRLVRAVGRGESK